jgi:hypothetical protein
MKVTNDKPFTLSALRDALLPKLLSGELRVPGGFIRRRDGLAIARQKQ